MSTPALGLRIVVVSCAFACVLSKVADAATVGLHVSGNRLLDGSGNVVHLHGVNRSGTEYACIQGWGIFDGPSSDASVAAIAAWHSNIVRVPLNEDCWLNINGVDGAYAGANYRQAIVDYVNLLHRHGMYAELSLMWGAPGTNRATYQPNAPDEDHSPAMWQGMASTFKDDPNVILAPWGETTVGWTCFMHGCSDQAQYGGNINGPYQSAGMQQAVDVMRAAGYHGPIAIPCIAYANRCGTDPDGVDYNGSTWLKSHPIDPANQLVAEAHVYGKNFCDNAACFDSSYKPLAQQFPLIYGETGETWDDSDCGSSRIASIIGWADANQIAGYEAWTWDTWGNCSALIGDYAGTPYSAYGAWVRDHYATLPGAGGSLPSQGGGGSPAPGAVVRASWPGNYKLLSGRIYRHRSGLWRLSATDRRRLEVSAVRRRRRFLADIEVIGILQRTSLATLQRLAITYVGSASRPNATVTTSAYDWRSRRWQRLARRRATTRDRHLRWAVTANPRRFASGRGRVWLRLTLESGRPVRLRVDSVRFAATSLQ